MTRPAETEMPPRPPECRPPADTMWQFGSARMTPRGLEGDPCGSGPVPKISSDADRAST
jgi:hypothetical protein